MVHVPRASVTIRDASWAREDACPGCKADWKAAQTSCSISCGENEPAVVRSLPSNNGF